MIIFSEDDISLLYIKSLKSKTNQKVNDFKRKNKQ